MNILGISAFYHDSAAFLVRDGAIIAAAQEERFSRRKHDAEFPRQAIAYCLRAGGITQDAVDVAVFYEKPLLKFERIVEAHRDLLTEVEKKIKVNAAKHPVEKSIGLGKGI